MKKVYLETFGCQMNVSDSERTLTLLESEGFEITSSEQNADVVILNTCSVREKAEHKLYTRVGQLKKAFNNEKKVGVMVCVAQLEGENLFENERGIDFVIGTKAIGRIPNTINKVFETKKNICSIPGVGNKVADCIMLFSLNKLEAFPLDRWMIRILEKY